MTRDGGHGRGRGASEPRNATREKKSQKKSVRTTPRASRAQYHLRGMYRSTFLPEVCRGTSKRVSKTTFPTRERQRSTPYVLHDATAKERTNATLQELKKVDENSSCFAAHFH